MDSARSMRAVKGSLATPFTMGIRNRMYAVEDQSAPIPEESEQVSLEGSTSQKKRLPVHFCLFRERLSPTPAWRYFPLPHV
jgi:hypothetical protein